MHVDCMHPGATIQGRQCIAKEWGILNQRSGITRQGDLLNGRREGGTNLTSKTKRLLGSRGLKTSARGGLPGQPDVDGFDVVKDRRVRLHILQERTNTLIDISRRLARVGEVDLQLDASENPSSGEGVPVRANKRADSEGVGDILTGDFGTSLGGMRNNLVLNFERYNGHGWHV